MATATIVKNSDTDALTVSRTALKLLEPTQSTGVYAKASGLDPEAVYEMNGSEVQSLCREMQMII
jgi:hypothetical protein